MSGDDLLPRIMAKVEIVEGGCWLWHGLVASNGLTPRFRFSKDGKRLEFSVRRVLYEHYIGEPPKNIHVSCGNPRCVNPAHVEIVVAKTNAEVCREYQAKKAQKQLSSLDAKSVVPADGQNSRVKKAQKQLSSLDRVRRLARRCGFRFVETSKGIYDICRS